MPGRSRRCLSVLCALLVLSCTPHTAEAGGGVPITGRIADPDGRPVPGASVMLVSGQAVASETTTNDEGAFELEAPEGQFEIRAGADGFRARPLRVTIGVSAHDVGTITLQVSAIAESVVVSAAQVEVPLSTTASAVTVLTGEELRTRQYETVADALRSVPGLTVAASGGRGTLTSAFPRGGESDYSLVVVDGVQANAFGGGFDFAHLPALNVERIEVVRGPQSALYGANAIGSVVRIVTKRGGTPTVEGSIEGGSFDTLRLTAATAGGVRSLQWSASAERLTSDGLNGTIAPNGDTVSNDEYERTTGAAGAAWRSPAGASARADVRFARDERGAPGAFGRDPGGSFFGIDRVSVGTNDRWLAAAGGGAPLGAAARAHVLITHSRTDGLFTSAFGDSDTWSRRTTARLQLDGSIAKRLETSAGAEVLRERGGSTFIQSAGDMTPVRRSLAGLFAEARWNHAARAFVTAGVRLERISRDALGADLVIADRPALAEDTVTSINPKIAAAWYVRASDGDFTRLRGSAGTGIRPPDAFELAFTDNPQLAPERSRSIDVGLDHAIADGRVLLESTAFFNSFDDLIVAVGSFSESSRYRTDNISNARARGLELGATTRGRRGALDVQLRLAYTLLDTEVLAADRASAAPAPFAVGDPLLRRPTHQFAADVAVRTGRLAAFLRGGGRSSVDDVDPSLGTFGGVHRALGYTSWDAGASWAPARSFELIVRVTNLFDRQYEETLGYPALGRGVFAGLRLAARR